MPELCAVIPGKPIPTARPRVTRYGTYNPRRQSEYMEIIRSTLAVEMRRQHCEIARTGVPVAIDVVAAIPWPVSARVSDRGTTVPMIQRPDSDNFLKMAMDAASGVVFDDDSQVWRVTVEKWRVPEGKERLEITIRWDETLGL
jgi:Holliday junction resolvase RusA-like endonuclease